ncbi:MAG: zinc ribbon domain-containing protein [Clostridia bacterium]|nr:zinc ribbon domain-containing protein [Clostridia bacterium]
MTCKQCSAPLPDESRFCPYCMVRFDGEGGEERKLKKSKEKLIAFLLIAATLIIAAVIAVFAKTAGKKQPAAEQTNGYMPQPETTAAYAETEAETEAEKETVTVEINGDYYTPGTYFWSINGNGEIVLEDYEYYPF